MARLESAREKRQKQSAPLLGLGYDLHNGGESILQIFTVCE